MSLISAIAIIRLRCEVVEALLWKCATYCRYLKLYRWWVQGVRTFPWQPGSQCTHLTIIPKNWEAVALLPGGRKFCKRTQKWLQKKSFKTILFVFSGAVWTETQFFVLWNWSNFSCILLNFSQIGRETFRWDLSTVVGCSKGSRCTHTPPGSQAHSVHTLKRWFGGGHGLLRNSGGLGITVLYSVQCQYVTVATGHTGTILWVGF